MVITTSAPATASAGLPEIVASPAKGSHLLAVRFHRVMGYPAVSKLRVIGAPIRPMPRKAIRGRLLVMLRIPLQSRKKRVGGLLQNLAEPWMAEQSVQGSIHSVFWSKPPTRFRPNVR